MTPSLPVTRPRMTERRTSLIGAMLVAIGPMSMSLYTPAMPELVHAFASTESAIKLTLSFYFAGFAISQLISGTTSDVLGRRKATLIFMGIYLAGSLMAAFAPSVHVLLAGRLVQGIGASVGMTVSRALVRDQFTGTEAARILNLVGMMLAIGPAVSPTIGSFMLGLFGWQSIFFVMVGVGLTACLVVYTFMAETTVPDPAKGHPGTILRSYAELLTSPRFLSASLVLAGSVGALYGWSTMLPFILITKVGLTPAAFGLGMLVQSGLYFSGTVAARLAMRKLSPSGLVAPGLVMVGLAAAAMVVTGHFVTPTFIGVMGPVGLYSFALAAGAMWWRSLRRMKTKRLI